MTVTNTVSKQSYASTGSTTVWPFSFPLDRDSDLALIVTAADRTEATVDPARYRLDRVAGTPGGSVTYPLSGPALVAGQTVTVLRRLPVTQATSLVTGAAFYAEDLERALDRLTMIDQQQQEQLDRTLKQPVSDPAGVALTLPPVAQRAGKSLKFDGSGALVATRFDPDAQQAAAAASAAAAAVSATAADADRVLAEAAAATAVTARETAVVSAAAAAAAAAAIGQETVEAVTADRAAVLADNGKVFAVNAAAGPVTITLPLIAVVGEPFRLTVKKTDNTANVVSVVASGTDTLDGGTAPLRLRVQQGGARLDSDIDPSPDNWVSQSFGLAVGDATPVGAEMWFAGTTPPPGWLVENGALLSRAIYPDLWAHANASGMLVTEANWQAVVSNRASFSNGDGSTTFRLPDLTTDGLFIRAQPATAPNFGRRQEDAFQAFQMVNSLDSSLKLTNNGLEGLGASPTSAPGAGRVHVTNGAAVPLNSLIPGEYNGNGTPRTASETRPKNAGRLPIIKAFSVPVDSKSIDVTALAAQVATARRRLLTVTDTLVMVLPSGYARYHIDFDKVLASVSGAHLFLQVSSDGGATWATGAAYKSTRIATGTNSPSGVSAANSDATTAITLGADMGSAGPQYAWKGGIGLSALVTAGASSGLIVQFSAAGLSNGGYLTTNHGSGWYAAAAVNAVRIIASSGTLTGTAVLYGEP